MKFLRTTEKHKQYWTHRKIDWQKDYTSTWNHPHRAVISGALRLFGWLSLIEIGCGGGANLVRIVKDFPGRQVGGVDVNQDAIDVCNKVLQGGHFKVGSGDDVMMSDKSADVVLTDMMLIYVSPMKIRKYLGEIKRIARTHIVLCEFHSTSWWNRLALKLNTGYYAHNYQKILTKLGFYDVLEYKVKEEEWPGGSPQKEFAYIIVAKVPKR